MKKLRKNKWSILSIVMFTILILYTISLLTPIIWAFITSFKGMIDFTKNPFGLPKKWLFKNYGVALSKFYVEIAQPVKRRVYMSELYLNSLLYSVGGAVITTLVPCVVAYMTAKFRYRFSTWVVNLVILCMLLPIIGSLPSEIMMSKRLGLYDKIWGIWIMGASFLGMFFLIFRAAFKVIPDTFSEAAAIDGCSELGILIKIILPITRNTIFTVMLVKFIGLWNDYQTPLIFIPNKPTIAYGMYEFSLRTDNQLSSVPMKLTGAMLMFVPILIIYIVFHKRLIGNLTMGGIKG